MLQEKIFYTMLMLLTMVSCSPEEDVSAQRAVVLDDPLASYAWHLHNTGQKNFALFPGTRGMDSNINAVHNKGYSGEGIRIAVSDSGVAVDHEDLFSNGLSGEHRNYNLAFDRNEDVLLWWRGKTVDPTGHGTAVAGLLGAVGGNGVGSYGVAYNARFAGFSYIGITCPGLTENCTTLAKYIHQAGGFFDIFNYSYGNPTCSYTSAYTTYIQQLKYGVSNYRGGKGAIYVKAGGNEWYKGLDYCIPDEVVDDEDPNDHYFGNASFDGDVNWPYQILVGALNADGVRTSYSSPGSSLWVSAAGGENGILYPAMMTTDLSGCSNGYSARRRIYNDFEYGPVDGVSGDGDLNRGCNYTSTMNGTSSAAPVASGIIALMLEANGNLTWRDVKYILAKTAIKVHSNIGDAKHPLKAKQLANHVYLPGWITNGAGFNFHNSYGFGGIDAKAAVEMAEVYESSLGNFRETGWTASGSLTSSIPDNSATGVSHSISIEGDGKSVIIESVQIELTATHPSVSDIGVELTSPAGTKSVLMTINSQIKVENISGWTLSSNAFYGESSTGEGGWTIKLIDGFSGNTGTLDSWSIKFFGHTKR